MKHRDFLRFLALSALALPALAQAQAGPAPSDVLATAAKAPSRESAEENSGQDPTKPVTRFDVREQYSNLPQGFDSGTLTLRVDKPFELGGGWKLNTRLDIPLSVKDVSDPATMRRRTDYGLDDILVQGLLIKPLDRYWAVAAGTQLLIPTGTPSQFTSGKWQLVPTVAVVRQLPQISRGSFAGLLVRDTFSFAGNDGHADINVLSIEPLFNVQLRDRWFVTLSPEIKLNTRDDWKAFVPFDITVGKKVTPSIVVSLQADVALVNTYRTYDWKAEFRVGFFF